MKTTTIRRGINDAIAVRVIRGHAIFRLGKRKNKCFKSVCSKTNEPASINTHCHFSKTMINKCNF